MCASPAWRRLVILGLMLLVDSHVGRRGGGSRTAALFLRNNSDGGEVAHSVGPCYVERKDGSLLCAMLGGRLGTNLVPLFVNDVWEMWWGKGSSLSWPEEGEDVIVKGNLSQMWKITSSSLFLEGLTGSQGRSGRPRVAWWG
jgi:hypothetical protein